MNLVRIDFEVRCTQEQAESLIGEVDHVEYLGEAGIAKLHTTITSKDHLLADASKGLERIEELLGAAGLSYEDGLELSLGTEALIEDGGVWRRRGEIVLDSLQRS